MLLTDGGCVQSLLLAIHLINIGHCNDILLGVVLVAVAKVDLRDRSLITGRGGGYIMVGGQVKFYPDKKGRRIWF